MTTPRRAPSSSDPGVAGGRARSARLRARHAAAKTPHQVRCKIDSCGAEVSSTKASQHAWEAHRRAVYGGDLALFAAVGAAA